MRLSTCLIATSLSHFQGLDHVEPPNPTPDDEPGQNRRRSDDEKDAQDYQTFPGGIRTSLPISSGEAKVCTSARPVPCRTIALSAVNGSGSTHS